MDWLRIAIDSYKDNLRFGLELYNQDIEKAILYAKENSTAGSKAKELALEEMRAEGLI